MSKAYKAYMRTKIMRRQSGMISAARKPESCVQFVQNKALILKTHVFEVNPIIIIGDDLM